MAYDIAQLDSADFAELADTLGDTPETVVAVHLLKKNCARPLSQEVPLPSVQLSSRATSIQKNPGDLGPRREHCGNCFSWWKVGIV